MQAPSICSTIVLFMLAANTGQAQELGKPVNRKAGEIFRMEFENLPETMFQMDHPDAVCLVTVRLPDDYDSTDLFPLTVHLEGGNGGPGTNIGAGNRIGGTDRSIVASLPLFKRVKPDPQVPWSIGVDFADYRVISEAYKVILDRLHQEIPNIDPTRSVLGGHSNGAKTVAVLLSALDETILSTFHGFYFIDGGFQWTGIGDTEVLGERHILFLTGGGTAEPEWWREQMVGRVRYFEECSRRLGVEDHWRFIITEGVGHAFVPEYYPILSQWARAVGD